MTKISNKIAYNIKTLVNVNDYVIGTDSETSNKKTKNFLVGDLAAFIIGGLSPEVGGTIKITEITPTTSETDPVVVANALAPDYEVAQYELLFLNLNGIVHLLKLVNRSIGAESTALPSGSFISFSNHTPRNVGGAIGLYKGKNGLFFDFKTLESLSLLIAQNEAQEKVSIELDILSDSFIVTKPTVGTFRIEQPASAVIPALYVNNLYVPTYNDWVAAGGNLVSNPSFDYKGEGTIAKPITDTVRYTSPTVKTTTANSAIQNALDKYVGTGSRLAPQLLGQKIIVQDNRPNSAYTFAGDFNYTGLDIELQRNVLSTTVGFLVDMDDNTAFNATTSRVTVTLADNVFLQIQGSGYNNSGSTVATNTFATGRLLVFNGNGTIYSAQNDITKYLFNSDPDSDANGTTGCNNDGNLAIVVNCKVRADFQGVYKVGGLSKIEFTNSIASGLLGGTINDDLKAFVSNGGTVRLFGTEVSLFGGTDRIDGFIFNRENGFTPNIIATNCQFTGYADNWFTKNDTGNANFTMTNCNTLFFGGLELFESPDLWNVTFRNNLFESVNVDFTKVDFTNSNTVSSINTIGGNVIESLQIFASRALAADSSTLKKGGAFINRKTVNAGSFVVGREYQILTVGSTDFTSIGASANTVGVNFTATGVGSGTGTAYFYTRDILI